MLFEIKFSNMHFFSGFLAQFIHPYFKSLQVSVVKNAPTTAGLLGEHTVTNPQPQQQLFVGDRDSLNCSHLLKSCFVIGSDSSKLGTEAKVLGQLHVP